MDERGDTSCLKAFYTFDVQFISRLYFTIGFSIATYCTCIWGQEGSPVTLRVHVVFDSHSRAGNIFMFFSFRLTVIFFFFFFFFIFSLMDISLRACLDEVIKRVFRKISDGTWGYQISFLFEIKYETRLSIVELWSLRLSLGINQLWYFDNNVLWNDIWPHILPTRHFRRMNIQLLHEPLSSLLKPRLTP